MKRSVLWAASLFALGFLVLVWPVTDDGEACGFAILEAFEHLGQDSSQDQVDCTTKARGRLGYGFVLLLLSVPPAFISLLPTKDPEDEGELLR